MERCHYCNDAIPAGREHRLRVNAWDTGQPVDRLFCGERCLAGWKREGGEGTAGPAGLRELFQF